MKKQNIKPKDKINPETNQIIYGLKYLMQDQSIHFRGNDTFLMPLTKIENKQINK